MTKRKPDKSNNGIDLAADGIDRRKKNIFYDLTDRATDSLTNGIRSQKIIGMLLPPGTCPGCRVGKPVGGLVFGKKKGRTVPVVRTIVVAGSRQTVYLYIILGLLPVGA